MLSSYICLVEQYRKSIVILFTLFQDIKLEDLDPKSAPGFDSRNKNQQWSQSEYFMAFSKERDVHQASAAYAHLDVRGFIKLSTAKWCLEPFPPK